MNQIKAAQGIRPPGPSLLETLKLFLQNTSNPPHTMGSGRTKYGDVYRMRLGPDRVVFVHDPELVGEMLLDKKQMFQRDAILRSLSSVLGHGLLTTDGEFWRRQRRLIAPKLSRKQIMLYGDAMGRLAMDTVDSWRDGQEVEVHREMMELTLAIVAETLFGTSVEGNATMVGEALEQALIDFNLLVQGWRRLFPRSVPFPARKRLNRASTNIDIVIRRMIQEKKNGPLDGNDLLTLLIVANQEEDDEQMTDQQIRDESITMLAAGHETTANALTFAMLLLSEDEETVARLRAEAREVLGDETPSARHYGELKFAQAVAKETLRLYPPAWIFGREALRDDTLGPWRIEEGEMCIALPWILHRDERHFEYPTLFRPDRWLEGIEDEIHRFAFVPFGGGKHVCIGNHFAMMELVLALAAIGREIEMTRIDTGDVKLLPSVTLRPKDEIRMRVKRV